MDTPTITPSRPLPIEQFDNKRLRDAVFKALEGVDEGHGSAVLNIENKGAGVMVVQRFADVYGLHWGAVLAGRYDFDVRKPEIQVTLAAEW